MLESLQFPNSSKISPWLQSTRGFLSGGTIGEQSLEVAEAARDVRASYDEGVLPMNIFGHVCKKHKG